MCLAAGRADELLSQVTEAINAGAVPPPYQEDLTARANELVNTVNCPAPVEEAPPEADEEEKKDKDEEKKEEKEKKKEEEQDGEEGPPEDLLPGEGDG